MLHDKNVPLKTLLLEQNTDRELGLQTILRTSGLERLSSSVQYRIVISRLLITDITFNIEYLLTFFFKIRISLG